MNDRAYEDLVPIEYAAFHESGHAIACILAWRHVQLPADAPPVLPGPALKFVEVTEDETGGWGGYTQHSRPLYSTRWSEDRLDAKWRDALEWEITYTLAGGLSEAIHRGERYSHVLLQIAVEHCGMAWETKPGSTRISDYHHFIALRDDLWRHERGGLARPSQRTFTLLKKNWRAVEAVAAALIQCERIEGADVEQIFDQAMKPRRSKMPVLRAGDGA